MTKRERERGREGERESENEKKAAKNEGWSELDKEKGRPSCWSGDGSSSRDDEATV